MVEQDPEALEELLRVAGKRTTPVTLIGDEVVAGFDRKRLAALLGLKQKEESKRGDEMTDDKKKFGWLGSLFSGFMSSA